jgi:hypothetical protein
MLSTGKKNPPLRLLVRGPAPDVFPTSVSLLEINETYTTRSTPKVPVG